jgi:hypothetical protein
MDSCDVFHAPSANISPWNRTLCGVLEEMRTCYETRNFAPLKGLIEEAQIYGNRMEAKLADVKEYEQLKEKYKEMQREVSRLEKQAGKKGKSPFRSKRFANL